MPHLALLPVLLALSQSPDTRDGAVRAAPGAPVPAAVDDVPIGRPAPDVLVILADDFNWVDLQSVDAPRIAELASRGMTFKNAYSFPMCSITRYSLLFGRYPRRDGIGTIVHPIPPGPGNPSPTMGLPTLPTVVRFTPRGFYSGAYIGKWHLGTNPEYDGDPAPDIGAADIGAMTPLFHGFDRFLAGTMANLIGAGGYSSWVRVDDGVYSNASEYAPQAQLDAFRAWWSAGSSGRLAVVATHLAHTPLHVPPPDWLPKGYPTPTNAREVFEAMIVACDTLVGRLLAEVDLANTYVFLLVDNGTQRGLSITACGPHATFEGCTKTTVWQGGINLPFIVAGPGIPTATTQAVVSSTDVMATIAELLGVPSSGEDSISFAPVLLDPSARTRRIAFTEIFGTFREPSGGFYYREETAAIGERYKLRRLDGAEFFFDLQADPGETVLLDPDDRSLETVVRELRAVLDDPLDRTLQSY